MLLRARPKAPPGKAGPARCRTNCVDCGDHKLKTKTLALPTPSVEEHDRVPSPSRGSRPSPLPNHARSIRTAFTLTRNRCCTRALRGITRPCLACIGPYTCKEPAAAPRYQLKSSARRHARLVLTSRWLKHRLHLTSWREGPTDACRAELKNVSYPTTCIPLLRFHIRHIDGRPMYFQPLLAAIGSPPFRIARP